MSWTLTKKLDTFAGPGEIIQNWYACTGVIYRDYKVSSVRYLHPKVPGEILEEGSGAGPSS